MSEQYCILICDMYLSHDMIENMHMNVFVSELRNADDDNGQLSVVVDVLQFSFAVFFVAFNLWFRNYI